MRESMALHETRDQETWQLSGRTELSRAPVSHGCAAQPLVAASHEEALRNVRKLLRAGLWAPGSGAAERSLNWDWHWDMSHWDTGINPVGRRNKQYLHIYQEQNLSWSFNYKVSRLHVYKRGRRYLWAGIWEPRKTMRRVNLYANYIFISLPTFSKHNL